MLFLPAVGPLLAAVVALFVLGFWGPFPGCFFLLSPSMPALSCAKHRRRCPRGHRSRGEALIPQTQITQQDDRGADDSDSAQRSEAQQSQFIKETIEIPVSAQK